MAYDKLSILFGQIEEKAIREVTKAINESLVEMKDAIDENTPIATGTLKDHTKIRPVTLDGNRLSWAVFNDTPYAPYVEYGVWGQKANYHKNWVVFYVWVGARMFTRAYDKLKDKIIQNIRNAL